MHTKRSAGFGMLGMALAMSVISVIVTTTMYYVFNQTKQDQKKTVATLQKNKNALIGFAAARGLLPDGSATGYQSVVPSLVDGYRNETGYAFDSRLTGAQEICSPTTTTTTITVTSGGSTISNVAFVLWSKGRNGKVDTATNPQLSGAWAAGITDTPYSNNATIQDISDDTDDLFVWATLSDVRLANQCN